MAPQAVILVGIQGSGKSSYCREVLFSSHVRINLDMLRTRGRERLLLEACLAAGQSFVVDNTNITRMHRARYIEPARERGFEVVGCYFPTELELALKRNRERPKQVPDPAIRAMARQLEPPALDEGFDELRTIRAEAGLFVVDQVQHGSAGNA